ncbi:NTP transferase domain-containing protein [Paracoccus cavernae]|uniref:NTP transferase domain-containing protein n=1 Tax=Paracoccus cavernae TaxID=1571207 RepID=A0ABT8D1J5_9RHOB|nr:NTP transferase domain-containing protein [Paracoccus cavernae]
MSIAIVLAAGASRRFGEADKMLAPVAGRALVLHAVDAVKAAGVARIAAVVSSPEVARILPEDVFALMIAPDQDMSASFHAAIDLALVGHPDWPARAPEGDGGKVLLVLGDMPAVSPASLRALLARRDTAAASCQGCACRRWRSPARISPLPAPRPKAIAARGRFWRDWHPKLWSPSRRARPATWMSKAISTGSEPARHAFDRR